MHFVMNFIFTIKYFDWDFLFNGSELDGWLACCASPQAYEFAEKVGFADDEILTLDMSGCLDAPL